MKKTSIKRFVLTALLFPVLGGQFAAGQIQDSSVVESNNSVQWIRSPDEDPAPRASRGPRLTAREKNAMVRNLERASRGHRQLFTPPNEFFTQFAEILKDKNAGLARIFPDSKCDEGNVVSVGELERCAGALQMPGGGSYYSFRNRTNLRPDKTWSDLHFIDGALATVDKEVFGLIGQIGDVRLEDLTDKSEVVRFLDDYQPKTKTTELRAEIEIFRKGVTQGGVTYAQSVPLKLNATYILRSVAYRTRRNKNFYDNREDIIVAFRVVAREPNGSLILLWKKLKSKSAPELKEK